MNADAVISAASGLGGILVGSGIVVAVVKAKFAQVDTLQRDLAQLKDERVAKLEQRQAQFESGCGHRHEKLGESMRQIDHLAADMSNLIGWTKKMDAKLDRLGEDAAGARATAESQKLWLGNLDAAHQAHVRDRELHSHG